MAKTKIVPRESDLYATLVGFQDVKDSTDYPVDATVKVTIVGAAEDPITGATDLDMPYIAGTTGPDTEYRGVVPASVVLQKNTPYTAKIVATRPGGAKHTFRVDFVSGP